MKILANDGLVEEGVDLLTKAGFKLDTVKRDEKDLVKEIGNFDALLVRSATKVTREVLEAGAAGKLKVVGRGGVGTDNIDLEAAKELGVLVKFAPHGNTNAAAEHTIALMFAVARNVPQAHADLRNGVWNKKKYVGVELAGKTLGVVGCGRIGQSVAGKARALGMKTIGFDQYRMVDSNVEYVDDIADLYRESDFVTLHTGGTAVIVGDDEFKLMKRSAFLINASRGKNVSEKALIAALERGGIAGAALDCFEKEAKRDGQPFESRLREMDNVVMCSHLGASTKAAARRTGLEVAEVVRDYLISGSFVNSVNVGSTVEEEGQKVYTIYITHQDQPGMFGRFGTTLGEMGVNIRENNSRKLGKDTVQTVYLLHKKPTKDVLKAMAAIDGVVRVTD